MSDYLNYLQTISSPKTFQRKITYFRYNFRHIIKQLPPKARILEIGPGLGECLTFLNSRGFHDIDVIDNDQSILDHLGSRYHVSRKILSHNLLADLQKLDKYDLIILTQVLEHIPVSDHIPLLRELHHFLRNHGFIIITVPNMGNPLNLYERYGDVTHQTGFTDTSLREIARLSGVPDHHISVQGFHIPPSGLINIIRILLQKILHLFLRIIIIINGGAYSRFFTPNISLIIRK